MLAIADDNADDNAGNDKNEKQEEDGPNGDRAPRPTVPVLVIDSGTILISGTCADLGTFHRG
ncbi:MAG TPA: hypothetical protein DEB39_15015 [Planctomycetaceae bacterium]|nr:hypothetical protein [Planctomycetaceae bacterium]